MEAAINAVVLAAGEGTRMRSRKPKVLCEVLFKPMISWVTDALERAGIEDICVVVGHGSEEVCQVLGDRFTVAMQTKRLGTGHAVLQGEAFLNSHRDGHTLISVSYTHLDVYKRQGLHLHPPHRKAQRPLRPLLAL